MQRRHFTLGAAWAALVPLGTLSACGGSDNPTVRPVPASSVKIRLPQDHYLHPGAPTEWWWHIGTLRAGERTFGFEINAASFIDRGLAFTQVMLTDVAHQRHYQRTTPFLPPLAFRPYHWAQSDASKDWAVQLGQPESAFGVLDVIDPGTGYTSAPEVVFSGGGGMMASAVATVDPQTQQITAVVLLNPGIGYTSAPTVTLVGGGGSGAVVQAYPSFVRMQAHQADPSRNMHVQATLIDEISKMPIHFDLHMSQEGPPFMVNGTGVHGNDEGPDQLKNNNYYYSLTRIQTRGTITLAGEVFNVAGQTWMDHEYGLFGSADKPVQWILQDMQLNNGVCISNYCVFDGGLPTLGQARQSQATIQFPDGSTYFVDTKVTPVGRTWTSQISNTTYYLEFIVEIPDFQSQLHVRSLVDGQEFPVAGQAVYEGVAWAEGRFQNLAVRGTAWNEQAI